MPNIRPEMFNYWHALVWQLSGPANQHHACLRKGSGENGAKRVALTELHSIETKRHSRYPDLWAKTDLSLNQHYLSGHVADVSHKCIHWSHKTRMKNLENCDLDSNSVVLMLEEIRRRRIVVVMLDALNISDLI